METKKFKILNLYAGIGGNRKLWNTLGIDIEVTAVEIDEKIAKIYQDFFPEDKIIVGDAHQFLLEHYKEFDFIWSSPPCPTHSRINTLIVGKKRGGINPRFPDMKLYEEIIFLKHFFKGKWVVENVISYYEPLIKPFRSGRHFYWANFKIEEMGKSPIVRNNKGSVLKEKMLKRNIEINNWHNFKGDKRTIINNMVEASDGLKILKMAFKNIQQELNLEVRNSS